MIKIYPSVLSGELTAPASKAHAQRLLFASSLATTPTVIANVPDCRDIDTTIKCLKTFGCKISRSDTEAVVEPFPKTAPLIRVDLDFDQSGTTARFALALAAAMGISVEATGSTELTKRQMLSLTSRMALRGVSFSSFSIPLSMKGRLEGGSYSFRGDEGSQYISALMLALPLLRDDSTIEIISDFADRAFVDISLDSFNRFGINIEATEKGFFIPGKQYYKSPGYVSTEYDRGLAAAWAAAGSLGCYQGGHINVLTGPDSGLQSYRNTGVIIPLLSADFEHSAISMAENADLTTLVAATAFIKGADVELWDVPQLRFKETDRLKNISTCINSAGGKASFTESSITAGRDPQSPISAEPIDCKGDPWVFMSFALCSSLLKEPLLIKDENCAAKIYGDFLKDFKKLGGRFEIINE